MRSLLGYVPTIFAALGISLLTAFFLIPPRQPSFDQVLELSPKTINFGKIGAYRQASANLIVRNVSGETLRVGIKSDCGCTSLEPQSAELKPDASCEFKINYRPKGASESGSTSAESSTLFVQAGSSSVLVDEAVQLEASVFKPFVYDPDKLNKRVFAFQAADVNLALSLESDVESVELLGLPSFLTAGTLSEIHTDFRVVTLDVQLKPLSAAGEFHGEIALKVTTSFEATTVYLPVKIVARDPFICSHSVVTLFPSSSAEVFFDSAVPLRSWGLTGATTDIGGIEVCNVRDQTLELRSNSSTEASPDLGFLTVRFQVAKEGGDTVQLAKSIPVRVVSELSNGDKK